MALSSLAVGWQLGTSVPLGVLAGYTFYEVLHRRIHVSAPWGAYGRWARRHHFYHHFENGKMNHGVTSPLWDLVFGTYRKPELIHVPKRLCMEWLRDPATGGARRWARPITAPWGRR